MVLGEVGGDQRVGRPRHPELGSQAPPAAARPHAGRQRHRLPGPLADPLGREAARRRGERGRCPVVWRPAGRVRSAAASSSSCSATVKPRFSSLPRSSSLVPGRSRSASQARLNQIAFAAAALVGDLRLEDRQPAAAGRAQLRAPHLDLDRRLLPQLQLPEPDRLGAVAVAVGQVAEQVAEAPDPDLGGRLRRASGRLLAASSAAPRGSPAAAAERSGAASRRLRSSGSPPPIARSK